MSYTSGEKRRQGFGALMKYPAVQRYLRSDVSSIDCKQVEASRSQLWSFNIYSKTIPISTKLFSISSTKSAELIRYISICSWTLSQSMLLCFCWFISQTGIFAFRVYINWMSIIYSVIVRQSQPSGELVSLCSYDAAHGNYPQITEQILKNIKIVDKISYKYNEE